jgi:GntR family transcriptional regulator, transcriptional repressor for pyruvate dehydrogenase complex
MTSPTRISTFGQRRRSRRPQVEFGRIQPLRAHEYVAEQIRRHIALRLVGPGEALPSERELAAMFGVGRPTVQHALRLLEAERLVEARRGRLGGTFVLAPSDDAQVMEELIGRLLRRRQELEELLDYRCTVEPAVARIACETRRRTDLDAIEKTLAGMAAAVDEPGYMRCDTEFHLAVAAATHNRHFVRATEEMRLELNDALSLLPESETWHRRLSGEHEAIFAAIEARDADAAEEAAELHVAASARGVRAALAAIRRRRRGSP